MALWRNLCADAKRCSTVGLGFSYLELMRRCNNFQCSRSAVPLADRAIGNLQQWLIGTYHGVSKARLQVYLDKFVFRHNRRKTPAAAF